jgi:predicted ATPase/DNA-binding CsgD family transcriptional regulator
VCRKLDGIPLGLELAAARVRLLSIEQLAERLSDPFRLLSTSDRAAPDRHQTLWATLDWSYGLLSEPEQRLFERLSVFAGGWTLEAAEAVGSGDPVEADQLVNLLGRLVDKSLVVAEPTAEQGPRYRLLETLRQYAEQRLADRDEQQVVQQRHAHYFLPLYERAELELLTGADRVWLDRLEREHDNLRAALRFLIARADVDGALRLAGTARRFWWMRGYFTEGRGYLEQALALDARAGTGVPRLAARAKVQFGLGNLALAQGDLDAAREGLRASVDLYRELADWGGAAWALCVLGEEAVYRAEYTQARGLFQQAVAAGRASGQRAITAISLAWGAWPGVPGLAWPGATHEAARLGEIGETAQEALRVCRAIGFRPGVCVALLVLGEVRHQQGDTAAARALWDQSLAAAREVGFKHYVVPALINLARMTKDQGDTREAGRLLAESLRLSRELGDRLAIAGCLEALVELAGRRFDRAVCMAGAAATLRQSVGAPVSPTERVRVASRLDALRRCLGAATFESYWLEGCTAPADHIIRSALQLIEELSIVQPNSPPGGEATHAAAGLTRRERQVAALIARGQTNRQIAERLTIAEGTAGNHVQSILDKLGFHTRAQIASWATAHGLSTTPAE